MVTTVAASWSTVPERPGWYQSTIELTIPSIRRGADFPEMSRCV